VKLFLSIIFFIYLQFLQKRQWNLLGEEFNCGASVPRTGEQLKAKFENLKKEAKKKAAEERQQLIKTGGGPFMTPGKDSLLDHVAGMIPLCIEGTPASTDSDVLPMKGEY
jgi:Myb/SANT-like DNA-binding domain